MLRGVSKLESIIDGGDYCQGFIGQSLSTFDSTELTEGQSRYTEFYTGRRKEVVQCIPDVRLGDSLTMADLFFVPQMRNVVDRFGIDISGMLNDPCLDHIQSFEIRSVKCISLFQNIKNAMNYTKRFKIMKFLSKHTQKTNLALVLILLAGSNLF